jgi:hypothetical protein
MQELTTTATLVEYGTFEGGSPITAILARSELEAALNTHESAQLWFELGLDGDEETTRLTLDLTPTDLEEMLRRSTEDEVSLALDGDALAGLFADPDVEAHGLRGALAATVAIAAIAAPTSLAAVPQTSGVAATAQRATAAATVQTSGTAATAQISSVAAKAQISGVAAKAQISKTLVVRAGGVQIMRGLFR